MRRDMGHELDISGNKWLWLIIPGKLLNHTGNGTWGGGLLGTVPPGPAPCLEHSGSSVIPAEYRRNLSFQRFNLGA